jgi:hypothetical protein
MRLKVDACVETERGWINRVVIKRFDSAQVKITDAGALCLLPQQFGRSTRIR